MPETFKFSSASAVRAGILLWNGICLLIVMLAGWREGWRGVLYAIAICGPFAWLLQAYAFANTMDVIVDNEGLRRCFKGRAWLSIPWGNVSAIERKQRTMTPYNGGRSREITYIVIYTKDKPRTLLFWGRRFTFSSQMAGFAEFSGLVARCAANIQLQIKDV